MPFFDLCHVLVGGVHSVEDFASKAAKAEVASRLPLPETTKIIGVVFGELDCSFRASPLV
jgi:hypothetical protein